MRFIKKQLSLRLIVLIIGVAVIAIPIAIRVGPTAIAFVKERQDYLDQQTTADNEDADAKHSKDSKAVVGPGVAAPQDDYYERRRQYWEKRVERRLDDEDLDEQAGDDKDVDNKDKKAAKDKKDSKADKDDEEDVDDVDQELERRREYWRKRVEKDW